MTNKQAQITINAIKFMLDNAQYSDDVEEALNMAANALAEQRWIPCSERLPDLDKYSHGKIWKQKVLITGYFSFDDKKELFISEKFASDVVNNSVLDTVVVAWMPLPEPYREDKE